MITWHVDPPATRNTSGEPTSGATTATTGPVVSVQMTYRVTRDTSVIAAPFVCLVLPPAKPQFDNLHSDNLCQSVLRGRRPQKWPFHITKMMHEKHSQQAWVTLVLRTSGVNMCCVGADAELKVPGTDGQVDKRNSPVFSWSL